MGMLRGSSRLRIRHKEGIVAGRRWWLGKGSGAVDFSLGWYQSMEMPEDYGQWPGFRIVWVDILISNSSEGKLLSAEDEEKGSYPKKRSVSLYDNSEQYAEVVLYSSICSLHHYHSLDVLKLDLLNYSRGPRPVSSKLLTYSNVTQQVYIKLSANDKRLLFHWPPYTPYTFAIYHDQQGAVHCILFIFYPLGYYEATVHELTLISKSTVHHASNMVDPEPLGLIILMIWNLPYPGVWYRKKVIIREKSLHYQMSGGTLTHLA